MAKIDSHLISMMVESGMGWGEIKSALVKADRNYSQVSIAALMSAYNTSAAAIKKKAEEKDTQAEVIYDTVTVYGKSIQIRREHKENGIPAEVQDRMQELRILAEEGCKTCSWKPGAGLPCTMPASICRLGHAITPLEYSPSDLLDELEELEEKFRHPAPQAEQENELPKKRVKKENVFGETVNVPEKVHEGLSEVELSKLELKKLEVETELDGDSFTPGAIVEDALAEADAEDMSAAIDE